MGAGAVIWRGSEASREGAGMGKMKRLTRSLIVAPRDTGKGDFKKFSKLKVVKGRFRQTGSRVGKFHRGL